MRNTILIMPETSHTDSEVHGIVRTFWFIWALYTQPSFLAPQGIFVGSNPKCPQNTNPNVTKNMERAMAPPPRWMMDWSQVLWDVNGNELYTSLRWVTWWISSKTGSGTPPLFSKMFGKMFFSLFLGGKVASLCRIFSDFTCWSWTTFFVGWVSFFLWKMTLLQGKQILSWRNLCSTESWVFDEEIWEVYSIQYTVYMWNKIQNEYVILLSQQAFLKVVECLVSRNASIFYILIMYICNIDVFEI